MSETTDDDAHEELEHAYGESIDLMVQHIIDTEFYTVDFATKDQPHAANLLQTLHDGHHQGIRRPLAQEACQRLTVLAGPDGHLHGKQEPRRCCKCKPKLRRGQRGR